jgi:hypothetical protein
MHARGLFLLQRKQNKEHAMGEVIGHILFGALQVIGEFFGEMIFEGIGEIYRGALEGMWNRINGWYW